MRQFLFVVLAVAVIGASASLINHPPKPSVASGHIDIPVATLGDIFNHF